MTLPDFLCIGAQRAGTTWLHRLLTCHSDIFLPADKELHFFDEKPDLTDYQGLGTPGRPFYRDMDSRSDWRWYEKQFQEGRTRRAKGEITPYYAVSSESRVALIAERIPDLKIIYILRNPVRRAWSGFRLFWFLGRGNREIPLEPELLTKTVMHPVKLIHGDYKRNAGIWEKHFGLSRMLYLFFDDIVFRPENVLTQVLEFLKVDSRNAGSLVGPGKINEAPPLDMPDSLERALMEHFAGQEFFVKEKFGRTLEL